MYGSSKVTGLNHAEARTAEQRTLMEKIEQDGVCPFCAEHFKKYHPKPILKETDSWFLTTNMSPYEGTVHHFLFVYKTAHISKPSDMTDAAKVDLFSLIAWLEHEYAITGGVFFMRFGDPRMTGSSVEHLHAHLIVGEIGDDDREPIRVKMGWKKK